MGTRYQILRRLGSGGMAEVFLARAVGHGGFEKLVAVKQVRPQLASNPESRELFLREARVGSRLNHPHVVQSFDGGLEGEQLFLVQELVDGTDLRAVCDRVSEGAGRLSPAAIAYIGAKVCEALAYVFSVRDEKGQPLVRAHRDVSLGNVLVSRSGSVKLSDFGVARLGESRTAAGIVRGKWEYFPPELVKGIVDGRGDLFALGIVLYELVALRHPFAASTPEGHFDKARTVDPERPEGMPDGLWAVVAKALRRDVTARWATPEEMGEALEAFVFAQGQRMSDSVLARELAPMMPPPVPVELDPALADRPAIELNPPPQPALAESAPTPHRPMPAVPAPAPAPVAASQGEAWHPTSGPALGLDGRLTHAPRPAARPAGPQPGEVVVPVAAPETPNAQRPLAQVTRLEVAVPPVTEHYTSVRPEAPEKPPRPAWQRAAVAVAVLAGLAVAAGLAAGPLEQALHDRRVPAAWSEGVKLVNVESKPAGAQVYSGEDLLGTTPLSIPNDYPAGAPVMLTLKKAGYAPAQVNFPGGVATTVSATLKRGR